MNSFFLGLPVTSSLTHFVVFYSQGRLPEEFEIFDGSMPCSPHKLELFLERVAAFPFNIFVILNVESLRRDQQEIIVSLWSRRGEHSKPINLYCIQHRIPILHKSPWVNEYLWDNDLYHQLHFSQEKERHGLFRRQVFDKNCLEKVLVVSTARCGTGKTHFIREEIAKLEMVDSETDVAAVNIHEGSSLASLITLMSSKLSNGSNKKIVHFNVTVNVADQKSCWREMLNHFFTSLFILGSVHDPNNTQTLFKLRGRGNWHIFIEFPPLYSDIACGSTQEWLRHHIPILSYICSTREPPKKFMICNKTRRVCTYLRAYEDGSINRKFDPKSGKKSIVFLLDKSGSMEMEPIGGTESALEVATENMLKIFDSHVQIEDVSFCIHLFFTNNHTLCDSCTDLIKNIVNS